MIHTRKELIDTQWDVNTLFGIKGDGVVLGINRYIVGCKSDYMEECRMVQAWN